MLRAPRDLGGNGDLVQLLGQRDRRLVHMLLAIGAALRDHRLDLGVLARVERLEREVLELPLQLVDTEPMGERGVDLERLASLLHLLLAPEILERPQGAAGRRELDQDDLQVVGHRDDHLAVVLGLGVRVNSWNWIRVSLETPSTIRGSPLRNSARTSSAPTSVSSITVEERKRDRLVVEPQLGTDLRDAERVVDERLTERRSRPRVLATRSRRLARANPWSTFELMVATWASNSSKKSSCRSA